MWLIFIVVVLVIALLMVFLLMAIRMLSEQAKTQLNRYFLKNLETYDRLAENKNEEIDRLQEEVKTLEERVQAAKNRLQAMGGSRRQDSGGIRTGPEESPGDVRTGGSLLPGSWISGRLCLCAPSYED